MESASRTDFAITRFVVGAVLLLLALTFYYFAVLNVDYYKTGLLDLGWSDPSLYFAQAKAMMKDGYPYLNFGYQKMPSMYPPGYPALMLPWLKVLPDADSILAPFRTNQTIGLLLLLTTFGFYSYLEMPLTSGFAALLVATLPVFFTFCRSPLSEISASALIVLAFMFAYLGLKEERRWKIYLSAIFLGLSLDIRVQSLFFAPLLLAMALFPSKGRRLRWFLHCFGIMAVFTLAASPSLVLNTIQFHSPFKTGYDFWLTAGFTVDLPVRSTIFSPRHVPGSAAILWRELTLHPKTWSPARYLGTGTPFVAPFVILVCVGLFFIRLNRFVICAFLAGLSFFTLTSSMVPDFASMRSLPATANPLSRGCRFTCEMGSRKSFCGKTSRRFSGNFRSICRGLSGIPVAFALQHDPRPLASGSQTESNRLQALEALHFPTPPRESPWLMAERHFVEMFGREPGIILANISPVYLNCAFAATGLLRRISFLDKIYRILVARRCSSQIGQLAVAEKYATYWRHVFTIARRPSHWSNAA